ncbi:stage III sporulation protein AF [Paenibacillus sp. YSY-4.3]
MTWLADWLKDIIFVVLLATFIDLLLPNRSMERYVKLVVSLLILLTLITPVMRLFAPDAERRLEMAFMDDSGSGELQTAGTEEILRQGEQMRMQRQQEAIQWASEEAAKRMKDQIERETGQSVQRVAVRLETDKNDTEPAISAIEVYMAEQEQEQEQEQGQGLPRIEGQDNKSRDDPAKIAIAPVEPVRIEVKPQEHGDDNSIPVLAERGSDKDIGTSDTARERTENPPETGSSGLSRQIAGLLARDWGIPKEIVHVVIPENMK